MEMTLPLSDSASRALKKARQEPPDDAMEVNRVPAERLYFDLLPDNTIENVARLFRMKQKATNWARFLRSNDAACLYGVDGELAKFICYRFNAVLRSRWKYEGNESKSLLALKDAELVCRILMRVGENFKFLHLDNSYAEKLNSGNNLVELFEVCTKIESLFLASKGGSKNSENFCKKFTSMAPTHQKS